MPTHRRTFAGLPQEVSRARRWTRDLLGAHPCADDALLIVTELGTNAITHTASGGGDFLVVVTHAKAAVTITVTDLGGAHTRPHVTHPHSEAVGGRGLALVTICATKVSVSGDHGGHTVTAELHSKATEPKPC
ncbi:ATP-binding protein [Streptomyces sp. NPDC020412]|uniref:ATP-binding protein n=1 Tax=Streptomyces sp. NPDC020412 TaxID=3365073 RepID=UPI0037B0AF11